jgi:predicted metal-dependent enzyme (double-stranded beta helix superfamily)
VFDLHDFISGCRAAAVQREPVGGVRALLAAALSDCSSIADALPVTRAELCPLYSGADVTIVKVVWAPGMEFPPHNHLTWACNGIYRGAEHNVLYRLVDGALVETGVLDLREGDVGVLSDDAIHSVTNPRASDFSAAIHVYGGDFASLPRSNWLGDPPYRVRAEISQTRVMFDEANRGRG